MKLLIIGHSVVDNITQGDLHVIKPGGIFYTAAALKSLKKKDDSFELITTIDDTSNEYFKKVFSSFNLKHSIKIDEVLKIDLTVFEDGSREEVFNNMPEPLVLDSDIEHQNINGILINYISGKDIKLNELKKLRNNYSGLIYSDIHAMARTGFINTTRTVVKVVDYKLWLNQIDIVQTNEEELETISEGNTEQEKAEFILKHRPKILIVTKAENGAVLYYIEKDFLKCITKPAIKTDGRNFVGCGDVFGAYFFYSYISTLNIQSSFELAVKASGKITSFNGYNDFENFKEVKL